MQRFDFRFDEKWLPYLRIMGITPLTSSVDVGEGRLLARFGPWRVDTPLTNLESSTLTSDYKWFRAVGVHVSLADRGLTFGTNVDVGLCISFRKPVRGFDALGLVRHPGLTVTVFDPKGLQAALGESA